MPGTPPPGPRSVLTEAGRERLLSVLREHYAQGHLGLDDMSQRVGVVLSAAYTDEAAAALTGLPLPGGGLAAGRASRARAGQRRRHAQQMEPDAAWVPTPERFRDPSTRAIMRVWIDPADLSRHYVPEPDL